MCRILIASFVISSNAVFATNVLDRINGISLSQLTSVGGYTYACIRNQGVAVFDSSDPSHLRLLAEVGNFEKWEPTKIFAVNGKLYVLIKDGYSTFSLADPANPQLIENIHRGEDRKALGLVAIADQPVLLSHKYTASRIEAMDPATRTLHRLTSDCAQLGACDVDVKALAFDPARNLLFSIDDSNVRFRDVKVRVQQVSMTEGRIHLRSIPQSVYDFIFRIPNSSTRSK